MIWLGLGLCFAFFFLWALAEWERLASLPVEDRPRGW